jgi:hypothetical protein|tara:strand:+ start:1760 stop:1900 length:141 start_codon:yes stop_codon:yes gene_type:complete
MHAIGPMAAFGENKLKINAKKLFIVDYLWYISSILMEVTPPLKLKL